MTALGESQSKEVFARSYAPDGDAFPGSRLGCRLVGC